MSSSSLPTFNISSAAAIVEIPTRRPPPPDQQNHHRSPADIFTFILGGPVKMFALVCLGPGSCSQAVLKIKRRNQTHTVRELFYDDFVPISRETICRRHTSEKPIIHIVHDYSTATARQNALNQNGQIQTNIDGALEEFAASGDKVVVLCREYDGECIQHLTTTPLSFERIVFDRPKALEYLCRRFALDPSGSYASIVSELDSWSALGYLSNDIQSLVLTELNGGEGHYIVLAHVFQDLLPKILANEIEPPLAVTSTIIDDEEHFSIIMTETVDGLESFYTALAQGAIARAFGPPQRPVDDQGVNTTASVFHAMMGNPDAKLSEFQIELLTTPIMTKSAAPTNQHHQSAAAVGFIGGGSSLATTTQMGGTNDECNTATSDEPISPK